MNERSDIKLLLVAHVHDVIFKLQATYLYSQVWLTSAGRLIFRPIPCSLTCTSAVSHQVVACITTVDSCLFKCCSIGMTNSAIGSVIQRTTVYSCWMKVELIHDVHCVANVLLSELTGLQVLHLSQTALSLSTLRCSTTTHLHMSVHSQTTLLQVDMYECCFPQGYTLCYNCRWQSDCWKFQNDHFGHWLCHLELRMVQLLNENRSIKNKAGKNDCHPIRVQSC